MGRPRKDEATHKVRERLISAMADRLIREPVDAVTAVSYTHLTLPTNREV